MSDQAPDPTTPDVTTVPEAEHEPTTNELLHELVSHQQNQRAEIAQLRDELAKSRVAPVPQRSQVQSQEDLLRERMEQVEAHEFYCPGCGKLYHYQRECNGTGAAPHTPIEVVSTDELKSGDTAQHTPAPGVV